MTFVLFHVVKNMLTVCQRERTSQDDKTLGTDA
jgi:hypothetical protein